MGIYIIVIVFIVLIVFLTPKIVRFHKECKEYSENLQIIKNREFDNIITAIESIGTEPSTAILLVPDLDKANEEDYNIYIPENLNNPAAGKSISFEYNFENNDDFRAIFSGSRKKQQIENIKFREIKVPRIQLKSGKSQNVWSYERYLKKSNELKNILSIFSNNDQVSALESIIHEFKCIKINGGYVWAQYAEFPKCSICNRNCVFVAQVPGYLFNKKKYKFDIQESEIYLFVCRTHTDQLETVIQFY